MALILWYSDIDIVIPHTVISSKQMVYAVIVEKTYVRYLLES